MSQAQGTAEAGGTIEATGANADQIEFWNGRMGEQWTVYQDRLDHVIDPLGDAALESAEPAPGQNVLDIGCGCGATSLALAAKVAPGGAVLGVDISAPMVARARERSEAAELAVRPDFALADAASHRFEPGGFDLAFSRFGVMFFTDPQAAFANIRSGMRPGGQLAFVCWRPVTENQWVTTPLTAALAHLPPPEPVDPLAPGPFAFADPDRVRDVLAGADFADIDISPVDRTIGLGGGADAVAEATDFMVNVGPVSRLLADADPALRGKAVAAIEDAFEESRGERGVELGAACWLVQARS